MEDSRLDAAPRVPDGPRAGFHVPFRRALGRSMPLAEAVRVDAGPTEELRNHWVKIFGEMLVTQRVVARAAAFLVPNEVDLRAARGNTRRAAHA